MITNKKIRIPLNPSSMFIFLIICLLYFTADLAEAQVYKSAIAKSTGGAGRGAVESGDVQFLNPAMLVHLQGRYLFSSMNQTKDQSEFAVHISDNTRDSWMPGALSYWQNKFETAAGEEVREKNFAFSIAEFGGEHWAMGLTAHMLESEISNISYRQNNLDLGFNYNFSAQLGLGVVFYNLFEADNIPLELKRQGSFGAGITYIYQNIARYRLDFVSGADYEPGEGRVEAGIETFLSNWILWRLGGAASFKGQGGLWSAGLGFRGPVFQLNYAYQDPQDVDKEGIHTIDLVIPF